MDVTEAVTLLDQVIACLALPNTQPLTTKQRKAATRSRKGMEKVVTTLATLSVEHGVSVPKQPTSQMTSNLALVNQLEPVMRKLVGLLTLVGNNIDMARGDSWNTATTLYGMLQKVAHRDSQLKSQLAPVKEFFAYRTPVAKKAHPKQKGKKAALAAEKEAAAQATDESSVSATPTASTASATPSTDSATASTTAPVAPSNVAVVHTP
jgi:hypothetical protein